MKKSLRIQKVIRIAVVSFIAAAMLTGAAGCSGGGGGGTAEPPIDNTTSGVTMESLQGEWQGACVAADSSTYQTTSQTVSGTAGTLTIKIFTTAGCPGNPDVIAVVQGTLALGDEIMSQDDPQKKVRQSELTAGEAWCTPQSSGAVFLMNLQTAFGYSGWAKGVSKQINGRSYGDLAVPDVDGVEKDILRIEGTRLFSGDLDSDADAGGYPMLISPDCMTKK